MVGDVFHVVEEDGTANAVVAATHPRIGEGVIVGVAIIATYASFSRERCVSFDVFLWYRHGARAW